MKYLFIALEGKIHLTPLDYGDLWYCTTCGIDSADRVDLEVYAGRYLEELNLDEVKHGSFKEVRRCGNSLYFTVETIE